MALIQLITSVGSREEALILAHATVDGRLAACAQILGPITSVYRWEGRKKEAEEFLCVMKVPVERLDALVAFVGERHPYDMPEITAVESLFTDESYMAWAATQTLVGMGEGESQRDEETLIQP